MTEHTTRATALRRGTRVLVAVNGTDAPAIVVSCTHPAGYFRGCVLVRFENGVEQWLSREVMARAGSTGGEQQ